MLVERPGPAAEINWPAFEARLGRKLERQQVDLLSRPWYRHAAFVRGVAAAAATVLLLVTGLLALNRWLKPAVVSPPPPPMAWESTLRYEGSPRVAMEWGVTPRPEPAAAPAVEAPKTPAPEPTPNRLAWLAGGDSAWEGRDTTLVVLRYYNDPEDGAVEHRYTFQAAPR
jgi:hypothetical protein